MLQQDLIGGKKKGNSNNEARTVGRGYWGSYKDYIVRKRGQKYEKVDKLDYVHQFCPHVQSLY